MRYWWKSLAISMSILSSWRQRMSTEAQKRASAKYDADNTVRITLKLNKKTDADIIQKLESEPNKNAYIKAKLRE